jgi:hypothetical protein
MSLPPSNRQTLNSEYSADYKRESDLDPKPNNHSQIQRANPYQQTPHSLPNDQLHSAYPGFGPYNPRKHADPEPSNPASPAMISDELDHNSHDSLSSGERTKIDFRQLTSNGKEHGASAVDPSYKNLHPNVRLLFFFFLSARTCPT